MNVLYLKYAVTVAQHGSISKAAAALYMNQPNLSKAIKELEKSLDLTIFQRTPAGVIPTEQGEDFLRYAANILQQLEEMEHKYKKSMSDKIRLEISVPRASYITYAFAEFVNSFDAVKEIEIHFMETNSMEAIENVTKKGYSLGIIRYPACFEPYYLQLLHSKKLQKKDIWEYEYVVLLSADSPLAEKKTVALEDLQEYTELVHGDTHLPMLPSEEQDALLAKPHKKKIYVYERGSQFDFLNSIHHTYMWVSPIPPSLLAKHHLVQLCCEEEQPLYKDAFIFNKGHTFTCLEQNFLDTLEQVKHSLQHCGSVFTN